MAPEEEPAPLLDIIPIDVAPALEVNPLPRFEKPLHAGVKEARLLNDAPWVRSIGKLSMEVSTEGWRFPPPVLDTSPVKPQGAQKPEQLPAHSEQLQVKTD